MAGFGKSVIGKIRKTNEDSILVENEAVGILPNVFIIADGMGGHKAGDIASGMAINNIRVFLNNNQASDSALTALTNAIHEANANILERANSVSEYSGMGTTLLAATVSGGVAKIVNVGDSRLYALNTSQDIIRQITVDHSYVMELLRQGKITADEAASHPNKNFITRALGIEPAVKPDEFTYEMAEGDILLMCSDGLTNMLSDKDILNICKQENNLTDMLLKLLENANDKGGTDNISVILYSENNGV